MAVKSMDLTWITVSDIKKAKKFFVDTLGLEISSSAEEYGWLELKGKEGGCLLGVGQFSPEYDSGIRPGQNGVTTITVDDIVKTKEELESKGVQFIGDIIEVPGHVKMALFADLDGNKFQLVQAVM